MGTRQIKDKSVVGKRDDRGAHLEAEVDEGYVRKYDPVSGTFYSVKDSDWSIEDRPLNEK